MGIGTGHPSAFLWRVASGGVPGASLIHRDGWRSSVDTAFEDVWAGTATVYPFPAAAVALEALSDSASDTGAGVGARTLFVSGLDAALAPISETVALSGVTPVALSLSYLRIISAHAVTVGTSGANVGTLTIRRSADATVQARILPGIGSDQLGVYTTPAATNGYIVRWSFGAEVAKSVDFMMQCRIIGESWFTIRQRVGIAAAGQIDMTWTPIGAGSDIRVRAKKSTGTAPAVTTGFSILLVGVNA